ncbi:hypothetical protein SAMN02745117_00194 [Lampropedia hyalina DSM 16112]|uniref:Tetratricopeptide repeat-containing protein n=1 Tax=Lampropedia hyalina DSM 16112 TaxID=1122156 RepID=A0A1M4T0G6_9BURK|nr:hypothetical protein [Lampropedia hyalina]SHE37981.1 hypothetical protein SAMN02745117_00194 [Lampropedia hyalina DSM 16112]
MWERIKGLWQQQDHPELARSEQEQQTDLDFLSQELQAQRLDGLEQQLRPLTTSKFRPVAQRAERMLGLVWFHQRKYTKALPIFEDLARQTNSLNDWFNVVTSATLGGEIARGAGAFERALERQRSQADEASADAAAQPSIAMLHYFYACALRDAQAYEQAFEQLQILRTLFEKLSKGSDPERLHLRGLPSLEQLLELMVDVLSQSDSTSEAAGWVQAFGGKLDNAFQEPVQQAVVQLLQTASNDSAPS